MPVDKAFELGCDRVVVILTKPENILRNSKKEMIRRQEEKYGWEFLFVAANIDAVETAEHIGIRRDRAANYKQSPMGTAMMFEAVEHAVAPMRCCNTVSEDWAEKLKK